MIRIAPVLALLLLAGSPPAGAETVDSDPRAIEIANQVMKALGGKERWDALVGLRWTFASAVRDTVRPGRHHCWNKHSGWHRVEGKNRQGQAYVTLNRIGSSEGMAWVDSAAIAGDSLAKLIKRGNSLWTNDCYWMLMPYKLRDPGARLKYDGEAREGDKVFDKLALSFENVGETPGDRYWVYVNRANHRVEKWEYVLQGSSPPPEVWSWEGWEEHGGLWFPTAHRSGDHTIYTRDVETVSGFPATTFTAP